MLDLADIFFVGVVIAVLSVPFLFRLVPRNRFYGFRVPATLKDDKVWYVVNRHVAFEMIGLGIVLAGSAAIARQLEAGPVVRATLTVLLFGGLAVITIRHWSAANRLRAGRQA